MNMTIQSPSSGELQLRMKRPLPNLLAQGFQLGLRNWPCVVWAYAVNLVFALLAAVSLRDRTGLLPRPQPCCAKDCRHHRHQRSRGAVRSTSATPVSSPWRSTPPAGSICSSCWCSLFFSPAASLSSSPPSRHGFRCCCAVVSRTSGALCAPPFWPVALRPLSSAFCLAMRAALLARADAVYVERKCFYSTAISGVVVLLVALLLRLWWDLVEVYIVRNAMDGERSVHRALLPALRLLLPIFLPHLWQLPARWYSWRSRSRLVPLSLEGFSPRTRSGSLLSWHSLGSFSCSPAGSGSAVSRLPWSWLSIHPSSSGKRLAAEEMDTERMTSMMLRKVCRFAPGVGVLTGLSEPTLRDLVAEAADRALGQSGSRTRPSPARTEPEPCPAPPARQTGRGERSLDLAARSARNEISAGRRESRPGS